MQIWHLIDLIVENILYTLAMDENKYLCSEVFETMYIA